VRAMKHSFHLISAPLANINLSLSKVIFPDKLKKGKVIPIYIIDQFLCCQFSQKCLEKVMYNRLVEFAETYKIF